MGLSDSLKDWYTITIGRAIRVMHIENYQEGRELIFSDPCDVSQLELKAMRRRFDRVAVKYF